MSIKNIRTGVIGVGNMGKYHAEKYSKNSNLVGVFDKDMASSKKIADINSCNYFKDLDDLLSQVDAVSICVPTFLHEDIFAKVADYGVHALVEKPISSDLESALRMLEISNKSKIIAAVGHIERFNPINKTILDELNKSDTGTIISLLFQRFSPRPPQINDVGVIMDISIHDLDLSNYFAKSTSKNVQASGFIDSQSGHIFHSDILINYENGINSVCQSSWRSPVRKRSIEILTENKIIQGSYLDLSVTICSNEGILEEVNVSKKDALNAEILDFLNSIINKSKPGIDFKDAIEAIRLAQISEELIIKRG